MKRYYLAIIVLLTSWTLSGQVNPRENRYIFWGYPQNYLENEAKMGFESVEGALRAFPPAVECVVARQNALVTLDMLLHNTQNDHSEALYGFFERRFAAVAAALEKGDAARGNVGSKGDGDLQIFKMYNDGFILRSPSATVAVDLIRGGGADGKHFISDSLIRRIADCCDLLLISHNHGDHADLEVAKMFLNAGKKVFAPEEVLAKLPAAAAANSNPASVKEVSLKIIPGHQDEMPNNIYHITFAEGYSVAHTGDQYNHEDLDWISLLHEKYSTDVLLVNCWTMELHKTIAGFAPRYVITGHENEIEHSIDHREAYWMTMKKMEKSGYPYILMTFGEKWTLPGKKVSNSRQSSAKDNRDWAGTWRYAADNAAIAKAPVAVFMGNSITEGWARMDSSFFANHNFVGRGISGQTTTQMLCRFQQDVINLHPKYVVIMAGTNDIALNNGYISLENMLQNVISMCELARSNKIKVLLCSVTPCGKYPWRPAVEPAVLIPQFNAMLREYASGAKGVSYIDYFSAMALPDNSLPVELTYDGCHPTLDGYKIMEKIILKALRK